MFGRWRNQIAANEQFTTFAGAINHWIEEQISINRALIDENKRLNNEIVALQRRVAALEKKLAGAS